MKEGLPVAGSRLSSQPTKEAHCHVACWTWPEPPPARHL